MDMGREIAVAGRSNAGKSSVINTLIGRKLARTSKIPGCTQQIIFLQLGPQKRLADLPGYGYAVVSRAAKENWEKFLYDYLSKRQSLIGLLLIIDCRRGLQASDKILMQWALMHQTPVHILSNKADKLSRTKAMLSLSELQKACSDVDVSARCQLFSARTKIGLLEATKLIQHWLKLIP